VLLFSCGDGIDVGCEAWLSDHNKPRKFDLIGKNTVDYSKIVL
jgi:hypothetical protein